MRGLDYEDAIPRPRNPATSKPLAGDLIAVQPQQLDSEDVELFTTRVERDRALLPLATRLMHEAEENTGLVYNGATKLKVYHGISRRRYF